MLAEYRTCRKGLHQYLVTDKRCLLCQKEGRKKRYALNRDAELTRNRTWREQNKAKVVAYKAQWRKQNKAYFQDWHAKNRTKVRLKRAEWRKQNLYKINHHSNRRRALKKQAMPPWANLKLIQEFYILAQTLTKQTGIKHHVDHIYPLQSKYLCGLHVETNLQVLPGTENLSKGNRTWPGQLDCQRD